MELKINVPDSVGRMIRAANILLGDEARIEDEISNIIKEGLTVKIQKLIGAEIRSGTQDFIGKSVLTNTEESKAMVNQETHPSHMPFDDPSGIGDGLGDADNTEDQEEKPGFVPPVIQEQEPEDDTFSAMVQSGVTDEDIENDMAIEDPSLEAVVDSSATPLGDSSDSDSLFSHIAGLPRPDPYAEDPRVARNKARFAANDESRRAKVYAANSFGE